MTNLAALLVCALSAAPARALPPTTQTLEALHRDAAADPARFFDGAGLSVAALQPIAYAPLPPAPPALLPEAGVGSRLPASGARVDAPRVPGRDDPRERVAGGAAALLGAGLLATGLALGGSLALPLAGVGAVLLVVGLAIALRRR